MATSADPDSPPRAIDHYDGVGYSRSSRPTRVVVVNTDEPEYPGIEVDEVDEGTSVDDLQDEDVGSMMGVSISRAATHIRSATTPAAEKAAALHSGRKDGEFDSDEDATPTLERSQGILDILVPSTQENEKLHLGELPKPDPENETPSLPTPWMASPKKMVVPRSDALKSVLGGGFFSDRRRQSSTGDGLMKRFMPKGLPSLSKASELLPKMPSMASFSNLSNMSPTAMLFSNKNDTSGSPEPSRKRASTMMPSMAQSSSFNTKSDPAPVQGPPERAGNGTPRPTLLRRVTSDESLLYHTLSRASSLGDDSRFANQTEQVNSRAKAIRDSLQDRSSFRLPQLQLPPMPNILQAAGRTKWISTSDSAASPGLVGTPEAASESKTTLDNSRTPDFDQAVEGLEGDIVIMGGYRGSVLRSSVTGRQLWVPVKVGLNIRKVDLEVGLNPEDEENMEQKIYSSGMLQNIGPVDISKRLIKRLRESPNAQSGKLRVHDYGYDWRLSPHLLSKRLISFLERLECNQPDVEPKSRGAIILAHSLGGLITRHAVNQRPELFSGVVYAGTPNACVNILGPLRNGDAVLWSQRVLTAQVNFTLRTSFALLPLDGKCFIDKKTGEEYDVDFFNVDDWIKYRWSPCISSPLPPLNPPKGLVSRLAITGSDIKLPSFPGRSSPSSSSTSTAQSPQPDGPAKTSPHPSSSPERGSKTTRVADAAAAIEIGTEPAVPQMGLTNPQQHGKPTSSSISTACTIPYSQALAYLRRTLAEVKSFKQETLHRPSLSSQNLYPPFAVIYCKSVPTLAKAKVEGREGIMRADAYEDLAFGSGDGVVLAKEAMLPEGYEVVWGGRVRSDRGHLTLLGDLNAVGRALGAVGRGRGKGLGLGSGAMPKGVEGPEVKANEERNVGSGKGGNGREGREEKGLGVRGVGYIHRRQSASVG